MDNNQSVPTNALSALVGLLTEDIEHVSRFAATLIHYAESLVECGGLPDTKIVAELQENWGFADKATNTLCSQLDTLEGIVQQFNSIAQAEISGYVYIARESLNGYYKIGRAVDVPDRIRRLNNSIPGVKVDLIHEIATNNHSRLEKEIHTGLNGAHVTLEWFQLSDEKLEKLTSISYKIYSD